MIYRLIGCAWLIASFWFVTEVAKEVDLLDFNKNGRYKPPVALIGGCLIVWLWIQAAVAVLVYFAMR